VSRLSTMPRAALAREISATFADVLRLEQVDPTESFFEVGGDSLLGAHLVGRLSQTLDTAIPLWMLFESPSVNELVESLLDGVEIAAP
jgi:acyl carrier protein